MDVISYALSKKYTDEKIIEQKLKVATVEKELNDYKNTLAQVNVNQEPRQSVSGYGVLSLPKNAANSSAGVKLEGLTATNLVNGKGDNLEGWNNLAGVSLGTDDKLGFIKLTTLTGLSFCYNVSIYQGHKYYIQTQYIADGIEDNVVNILFRTPDNVSVGVLPLYNSTTNLTLTSKILTPTIDCDRLAFNRSMSGSGQYWFKELMLIDLTQTFGAGNEPTAEECDKIFANYFDDTKSTIGAMRITSENEDKTEKSTAYIIAKDKDNKIVNLRSLPNGVRDEVDLEKGELIKSISNDIPVFDIMYESIDTTTYTNVDIIKTTAFTDAKVGTVEVDGQTRYYDKNGVELTEIAQADIDLTTSAGKYCWDIDGTLCIIVEKGTYTDITAARTGLGVTSINYELVEPEIIPIQVSGNIVSNPGGTIYIEPAVVDANVYNNGITIFEQELNIDYIDKLYKIDYQTGVKTEIDASKAVIAEDKKSFTHPDLVNGDMVFFEYYYSNETTQGETTIEYYDSRYVIPDKTLPNKFYKWDIEVDNGVPSVAVTEV